MEATQKNVLCKLSENEYSPQVWNYSCTSPPSVKRIVSLVLYKINATFIFLQHHLQSGLKSTNVKHALNSPSIKLNWLEINESRICGWYYSSTIFNFTWAPSTVYFQCQVPLSISSLLIGSNLTRKPDDNNKFIQETMHDTSY